MPPSPLQQIRSNFSVEPSAFSRSMTTLEETGRHGIKEHAGQSHPNHPYRSGRPGPYAGSSLSVGPERGYSYSSASLDHERSRDDTGDARDAKSKATTKDSNLSPLTLSEEPAAAGQAGPSRKWSAWTFGSDAEAKEKQQDRGEENWVEHAKMKSPELNRDPTRVAATRWVESPMEMVDRSRPW